MIVNTTKLEEKKLWKNVYNFYLYAKKEKMIPDEEFQNENVKKEVNEFGERED